MAEPQPRSPRGIGLRSLVPDPFEAAQAVVAHPEVGCPIQALGSTLDCAPARKPRLDTALRRRIGDPRRAPLVIRLLPKQFKLGYFSNSRDARGHYLQRLSGAQQLLVYSVRPFPIPRKNMI